MFLEINDIKKSFGEGESKTEVLKGINAKIEKGEFCVLLGPSGSGKSTLLNIIGGIDSPDSGFISINGEKTADMSEKALMEYWDKVRKQYKAGTADRIAADNKYLDAAKAYNDKLEQIENDHLEATRDANQAYEDAIKDRTKAIMDAYDLFDAFESNSATGKELLFNIEAQAAGYEEWSDSIRDLEQRGIFSDELMQALTEKGPQDIAAIKALLMLTDEELRKYQAAYDRKETAAAEQAKKDSKDAKANLEEALAKANKERADELAKINTSISTELTSLVSQLKTLAEDETDRIVAAITGGKAPESVGKNVVVQAAPAPASTPAPAEMNGQAGSSSPVVRPVPLVCLLVTVKPVAMSPVTLKLYARTLTSVTV
jgi:energy-coupling factor transporter ATP-binding protein EcfA2